MPVVILRKKTEGENSLEEIAYRLKRTVGVRVVQCPSASTSIAGLARNILFVRKIRAPLYHIIAPSEAYLLPFLKGGKKIITYHDMGLILKGRNRLYSAARRMIQILPSRYFADCITFVSKHTEREYLQLCPGTSRRKLAVIYNAYDERLKRDDLSENNACFTILHVGTAERKNLDGMIRACRGLKVSFLIVGRLSAQQKDELKKSRLAYENYADIPFEKIVDLYNRCNMVSFPSKYEGFGLPVIEANAMGKAVVCGNIGVLREVGNDAALFVDPDNEENIRKAVVCLMKDDNLRNSLIQAGYQNAQRFSPKKIYTQYRQLYQKVRMTVIKNDAVC